MNSLVSRILVVDDDAAAQYTLSRILSTCGYTCVPASSGAEAIGVTRAGGIDLVVLDLMMPDVDGMETLSELKRLDPELPVIMVTGCDDVDAAVRATKLGAYDFVTKPARADKLTQTVQRALERFELQRSVRQLEASLEWIFGKSVVMGTAIRHIRKSAWSDAPVTIQGERGTGKSVAARIIHNLSRRSNLPFQTVNAGPTSESLFCDRLFNVGNSMPRVSITVSREVFESAQGGTVFIDGLGCIPLSAQARLADIIEEQKGHSPYGAKFPVMGIRLILGSDTDVGKLMSEKKLSERLSPWLTEPAVILPPLRDRPEDVLFLARKFLWKAAIELGREVDEIGGEVIDLLMHHPWPGNIRELKDVIRKSVLLSDDGVLTAETVRSAIDGERLVSPGPRRKSTPVTIDAELTTPGSDIVQARLEIEERYRDITRLSPMGIVVHLNGRIVFVNPAFARIIGAAGPRELSERIIFDFVHADSQDEIRKKVNNVLTAGERPPLVEVKLLKVDGSTVDVEATALPFKYQERDTVMLMIQNITERKRSEEAAKSKQRELEEKTVSLEEANAALKVLLSHRDQDKEELEKRILANVKKLVFPYIEKMKAGRLTDSQAAYVEIIESNLNHVISPFLQKMAAVYSHFTPTEIQVAALIKEGKTTKEIATVLNMGTGTVNTHRSGVRAKLGLRNKDVNLCSYVLSLE